MEAQATVEKTAEDPAWKATMWKGDILIVLHASGRISVNPGMETDGVRRILHPDSEEFKRLFREFQVELAARKVADDRRAAFEQFNKRTGEFVMPQVLPYVDGELLRVVRKDEKGQVRRFADWVVQFMKPPGSFPTATGTANGAFYVDPSQVKSIGAQTIVHEAFKADQKGWLVRLPEVIHVPQRLLLGMLPAPTSKENKPTTVAVFPDHWVRRLTASEARQIKGMQVGEPL